MDNNGSIQIEDGKESDCQPMSVDMFRAELDVFSGPLDLLLHLIKRDEVDILEIPISHITDSYLASLRTLQMLDINIASEFLVMAATLMDIKSRCLLPDPIDDNEGDDDPESELIHQLLEYKKFKKTAGKLRMMADQQAKTFPRRPPGEDLETEELELEDLLSDTDIWDCVSAYAEIIREIEMNTPQHIVFDEIPVAEYMEEVIHSVNQEGGRKDFLSFFGTDSRRTRIIGIFLALLELIRQDKIRLEQRSSDTAGIAVCSQD